MNVHLSSESKQPRFHGQEDVLRQAKERRGPPKDGDKMSGCGFGTEVRWMISGQIIATSHDLTLKGS